MRLWRFLPTFWWRPSAWKIWRTYVHWRLETYGVYYPGGTFHVKAFGPLFRQLTGYRRWLADFDRMRGNPYKTFR